MVQTSHLLSRLMIVRTSHTLTPSMLPPRYSSSPSRKWWESLPKLWRLTVTRDVLSTVTSPQYLTLLTPGSF